MNVEAREPAGRAATRLAHCMSRYQIIAGVPSVSENFTVTFHPCEVWHHPASARTSNAMRQMSRITG
jgi:hypothetical protein